MSNLGLKPRESLAFAHLGDKGGRKDVLNHEVRWHFSTSYFAEALGEDVLEHIRDHAPASKKVHALLGSQLRDESRHHALYKSAVEKIGLDPRADFYAKSFSELLKSQPSFCQKVFVFQLLTETVAKTYVGWRLKAVENSSLNGIDNEVYEDELRHIGFAAPMFALCDREELTTHLTPEFRKATVRKMLQFCIRSLRTDFNQSLEDFHLVGSLSENHSLDGLIPRALTSETARIKSLLDLWSRQ